MYRDRGHEPGVGIVKFVLHGRGAILLHSCRNGGNAGGLSFGDIQLLKEITNPTVTILAGTNDAFGEIIRFQRPVRTARIADIYGIGLNLDGNRLPLAIIIMVESVPY